MSETNDDLPFPTDERVETWDDSTLSDAYDYLIQREVPKWFYDDVIRESALRWRRQQ